MTGSKPRDNVKALMSQITSRYLLDSMGEFIQSKQVDKDVPFHDC